MKQIITSKTVSTVNLSEITGREIIVYRKHKSENIAILARLKKFNEQQPANILDLYGFTSLHSADTNPTYTSNTLRSSINKALEAGKAVYVFDSQIEFCQAIIDNKIL